MHDILLLIDESCHECVEHIKIITNKNKELIKFLKKKKILFNE